MGSDGVFFWFSSLVPILCRNPFALLAKVEYMFPMSFWSQQASSCVKRSQWSAAATTKMAKMVSTWRGWSQIKGLLAHDQNDNFPAYTEQVRFCPIVFNLKWWIAEPKHSILTQWFILNLEITTKLWTTLMRRHVCGKTRLVLLHV